MTASETWPTPRSARRGGALCTAGWLMRWSKVTAPSRPSSAQIANHYEQAGDIQQALIYYQRAAEVTLRFFAYQDAIAMLNHAVSLVRNLPAGPTTTEFELELQMRLCTAWAAITSYLGSEADAAYSRALELCRQVENKPYLFTVLWGLHEVALYRVEYEESLARPSMP